MNVLLTCAGRRTNFVEFFRDALAGRGQVIACDCSTTAPALQAAGWSLLLGSLVFSGSLYILALDSSQKWAGPLTPLGGLFLIAGWAWLWLNLIKKKSA